uniref:SFRICE_023216 n=1 Tax=Spodoptera frugiperda TaxID=7108 RepID=A0A2H1WPT3_SPOFR
MKFSLICVLLFACFTCYYAQEGNKFYCGRTLSRAIAVLCWSDESKRDAGWWPHHGSRILAGNRGKRGPADECCEKSCSVQELMSYC